MSVCFLYADVVVLTGLLRLLLRCSNTDNPTVRMLMCIFILLLALVFKLLVSYTYTKYSTVSCIIIFRINLFISKLLLFPHSIPQNHAPAGLHREGGVLPPFDGAGGSRGALWVCLVVDIKPEQN